MTNATIANISSGKNRYANITALAIQNTAAMIEPNSISISFMLTPTLSYLAHTVPSL